MNPLQPLALLFFVLGSYVSADVTIYRAKANLPTQGASVNVSAIGTASGQDGGTTYIEQKLISSLNVVYTSPPTTSLITNVRTETATFVEGDSWVYMSSPDDSGKFNAVEQNCTFAASQKTGVCVEVNRKVVNDTSTTLTVVSATTYNRKLVPVYTVTGLFPAQTQSRNAAGRVDSWNFLGWLPVISGFMMMIFA
ncbi:GPI-anchored small secreted protein [Laccaria bicolor S238N-H82]|uniref:GPI-anchored small secreted protein n=1 Tax=Laccaria bicolor (strain S238N-H82 / ATCC MYA-4686) TaxID=486041 RepID=B0DMD0_LACBS|nr:GPI-anchored small secreted protein [Laccaria bicolor S238N-H82]EDR04172.1 GPI-anchored small secreted protein [Laccaria bicolor S238N-H82]|eukprot:XP_001885063.1 GPI-anchored small secreted protein [Laccaria bicolor S238N-H82]